MFALRTCLSFEQNATPSGPKKRGRSRTRRPRAKIAMLHLPGRHRIKHHRGPFLVRFYAEGAVPNTDLDGYRAVLAHDDVDTYLPVLDRMRDSDHLRAGDVVVRFGGHDI